MDEVSFAWEKMLQLPYLESDWHLGLEEAPWPQDSSKTYLIITRWGEQAEARPEPGLNAWDTWGWNVLSKGSVTRIGDLPLDQYDIVAWCAVSN